MTVCEELLDEIYNHPERCFARNIHFYVKGCVFWAGLGFCIDKHADFPQACLSRSELRKVFKAYRWWCRNADIKNFTEPPSGFFNNTD